MGAWRSNKRWITAVIGVAAVVTVVLVLVVADGGDSEPEVTITSHAAVTPIPRSFLGFSTEYWTLPVDERHLQIYGRLLSYVHVPGDGPLILRIGGDSSDHAIFDPNYLLEPAYVFDITPRLVDGTALVVKRQHLRVILDLNLITGAPRLAAAWARDAEARLPRGSILGFEVGNEPDLYDYAFWRGVTRGIRVVDARRLPRVLTPQVYARDFETYARALRRVAPHVPLYAPVLADPGLDRKYISVLLATPHTGLKVISGHRYPYSRCIPISSSRFPTIDRLLSADATAGMARSLRPAIRLAHAANLPFVLTEFNSVTCGGLERVSNSFATGLWAPDAAFELLGAHIEGIHLHARQRAINDPFTFDSRGVTVRPLMYGLILFARTLGPNARLIPLRLRNATAQHLKVWAVKAGRDQVHVLLLNKGQHRLRVRLKLPATGDVTVERMLAPSRDAHGDVTLAGQQLNEDGRWQGQRARALIAPSHIGEYEATLPPFSAALLTGRLTQGALHEQSH
jgi:hypothetical protein